MMPADKELPQETYEAWYARWRRTSWGTVVVLMALALCVLWFAFGGIGILFWIPMAAWFVARGLVAGGSAAHGWSRRQLWQEVQGRHHAFDDIWVRIEDGGRGNFRIRTEDVLRVLALDLDDLALRKLGARLPPGALFRDQAGLWWFTEAALLDYLGQHAARQDGRAWRFRLWLEREVLPPLRRQAEKGAPGE